MISCIRHTKGFDRITKVFKEKHFCNHKRQKILVDLAFVVFWYYSRHLNIIDCLEHYSIILLLIQKATFLTNLIYIYFDLNVFGFIYGRKKCKTIVWNKAY